LYTVVHSIALFDQTYVCYFVSNRFPLFSRGHGNMSLDFGTVRVLWLPSSVFVFPHGDGKSPNQSIIHNQAAPLAHLGVRFGAKEGAGKAGKP